MLKVYKVDQTEVKEKSLYEQMIDDGLINKTLPSNKMDEIDSEIEEHRILPVIGQDDHMSTNEKQYDRIKQSEILGGGESYRSSKRKILLNRVK